MEANSPFPIVRTVAYITNQFPSAVEPYVLDELLELRRRGVQVIPCSARYPLRGLEDSLQQFAGETLYLQRICPVLLLRALWFCLRRASFLTDLWKRIFVEGSESPSRRVRALLHTLLGVYYALLLEDRGVDHIHVHHGYFSSWIAMVAARVLGISFSMTLHGSDLLLHKAYLDTKLNYCQFCATISDYNRQRLVEDYPAAHNKIFVQRIGVDLPASPAATPEPRPHSMILLAVGRLHQVKDHAFLIRACRVLKDRGVPLLCLIAGEGPERPQLTRLIAGLKLDGTVQLLGHVAHQQLDSYYALAEVVVLTSQSEGIPLVLMEAMARGRLVVAPDITGISELVLNGSTGFLYKPGSLNDFAALIEVIYRLRPGFDPIRRAARQHVIAHFNREKNLAGFTDMFCRQIWGNHQYADSLLQQI
jgi:colanic acid/amylovoran biosynthesis glycosyltransferase